MAKRIEDEFTTTAQQDMVLREYGTDLNVQVVIECKRCGGSGWIESFKYVEGGICFECMGRPELVRRYVTVGKLLSNAKDRDREAARKARAKAAERSALEVWKAENVELLARAEKVGCLWFQNWRYAPEAHQVENLASAVEEREAKEAEKAARLATAERVPEGRGTITGVVVSWKMVEDHFSYSGGSTLKILVEDDRGFRVFGTCPTKLSDDIYDGFYADRERDYDGPDVWKNEALRGARVTFTATVEPSDDDPYFGWFKRPTKPSVLAKTKAAQAALVAGDRR